MNSQTNVLNESIAQCKTALPLPELWKKLGLRGEPKQSCLSPFRDEANPSFSVFQKNGLWFWKDFAAGTAGDEIGLIVQHRGCKKGKAIRLYHELAGIELPQFANQTDCEKSPGDAIAIYNYLDADGNLLHQTLRFAPKLFRQRRPASEGLRQGDRAAKRDRRGNWWLWTLDGIEPVLYRLPELLAASPSLPIFLCEGEKDVETLGSVLGGPTTTAPMGAGKWRESYTRTLRGRDVIIIPHRDPVGSTKAGQKHAALVAEKLSQGGAGRVRIVDWNKAWPEAAQDESRKLDVANFIERLESEIGQGELSALHDITLLKLLDAARDYVAQKQTPALENPRTPIQLPGHGRTLSEFAAELGALLHSTTIFNHGGVVMVLNEQRKKLEPVGQSFFRSWLENYVQPQGFVGTVKARGLRIKA
jgi:DNA primase